MARPKKNKIDYFPHYVTSGKTLFIMEQKWGNDGYAFWFKLLEIIGDTEGHYFCTENDADWEFLIAKTNVDSETASEMLNTLAKLNAIDPELWSQRIIWSQNFINNIQDVYIKRRLSIPKKPNNESFWNENYTSTDISGAETPQSKVKESKVNKRREKEENSPQKKYIVEADEFEKFLNENETWKEQVCMSTHTTPEEIETGIKEFSDKLKNENVKVKPVADIFAHFANWYRLKIQNKHEKDNGKGGRNFGFAKSGYDPNHGIGNREQISKKKRPEII